MKKLILFLVLVLMNGCAVKWSPITDPRASKEPKEIIRDTLECERLIENADAYKGIPARERSDWTIFGLKTCWTDCGRLNLPSNYNPLYSCMNGRGHSIINWK